MWAHYADAHAGFVVALNSHHSAFSSLGRLVQVEYSGRRLPICSGMSAETFHTAINTKSPDWSYEQEWRLVTELSTCESSSRNLYSKALDPQSIVGVIIGVRSNARLKRLIRGWAAEHGHVQVLQTRLDSLGFDLDSGFKLWISCGGLN